MMWQAWAVFVKGDEAQTEGGARLSERAAARSRKSPTSYGYSKMCRQRLYSSSISFLEQRGRSTVRMRSSYGFNTS